ncbi:hypothetical protein SODALDRAFT_356937 [Sodiomyces alkalinus F11]|uniref:Uncharacterized protein n=1 Tax=Sodiomyces alkalinus (strain CBS 110278 / VKM F-3762 / F11) TaxID=1314773 RepID=A0A3N2Q2F2_SODAK|nr:hypothetical protein SODALDRAFT_356937 [Sodiomyces alkalinus F11]ROT40917.1 hypothetical protein SODALDRAFT_356937 [Sodiomyces alkalinus F11]
MTGGNTTSSNKTDGHFLPIQYDFELLIRRERPSDTRRAPAEHDCFRQSIGPELLHDTGQKANDDGVRSPLQVQVPADFGTALLVVAFLNHATSSANGDEKLGRRGQQYVRPLRLLMRIGIVVRFEAQVELQFIPSTATQRQNLESTRLSSNPSRFDHLAVLACCRQSQPVGDEFQLLFASISFYNESIYSSFMSGSRWESFAALLKNEVTTLACSKPDATNMSPSCAPAMGGALVF